MFVHKQLKKYDGTVQSLTFKSRRPKTSPNKHSEEELALISLIYAIYGLYGKAEVYVRLKALGYKRSFGSMCMQLRKQEIKPVKRKKAILNITI